MQIITHAERIFSIPDFLNQAECAELIDLAEAKGFVSAAVRTSEGQRSMPSVRDNERAILESEGWVASLWKRLAGVPFPTLGGEVPLGLPKELRFYKYSNGQRFKMHKDGPWTENGVTSKFTFLIYLNDGFVGGDTDFRDFRIPPQMGSALLFNHDTWHEGAAVVQGTKYVLRSDVLYGPSSCS